ncbi:MAG: DUF2079 domain-containing protein [Bacteroidetes bacterium]|nr:DUF2079 domain-containing protein [Bacteroidota bacterium]
MKIRITPKHIPYFILILFGALLMTMSIMNHYYFRTFAFDYGNYNFAFWDYSHFRISHLPTATGTFLQDHYSYTLMYFVPVYWLMNWLTGTYTLVIIQNMLILIAGWYSYKLIMHKSNDHWLGIGGLLLYFLLLGRYTSFACDCNIAILSACFIPIFLYYFEVRRYVPATILFILSLFSRENIPIWFIFIFIYLIIEHRKERRVIYLSIAGIIISLAYFILLFKVLIPAVETPEKKFLLFNYAALGANPSEALMFIIRHPINTFMLLFTNHLPNPAYDGVKSEFYWVYLISGGILLILRPKYLIWFIPLVAQKELNDSPIRWGIASYYCIEIVTLLPLAVYLVLSDIKEKYLRYSLAVAVVIAALFVTLNKLEVANQKLKYASFPEKEQIYNRNFFKSPYNVKGLYHLLSLVPADAKVSASDFILPHLAQRQFIYFFPVVNDADYILISSVHNNYLFSSEANEQFRDQYLNSRAYEVVGEEYPVTLLKKKPLNAIQDSIVGCDAESLDRKGKYVVFSTGEISEAIKFRTDKMAHQGRYSLRFTKDNPYGASYHLFDFANYSKVEASVWAYSKKDDCQIVASAGKEFYVSSNAVTERTNDGWKKLKLEFKIPEIKGSDLTLYLWNCGQDTAYFDDFVVHKIK